VDENRLLTFVEKFAMLVVSTVVSLLLKVFQSVLLKAPVAELLASPNDSACPDKLSPLAVPIVTSPVLVPLRFDPVIVPDAAIEEGVMAPSVKVMAGVVVGVATDPLTPLAETTETVVTDPLPFELKVFQSVLLRYPLVDVVACVIPIVPPE
jgi:hypothetical protein